MKIQGNNFKLTKAGLFVFSCQGLTLLKPFPKLSLNGILVTLIYFFVFLISPVENVPNLNLLSAAVLRELKSHCLDFGEFVQKVAR